MTSNHEIEKKPPRSEDVCIAVVALASGKTKELPSVEQAQHLSQPSISEEEATDHAKGDWNGADDPDNPFNWPSRLKVAMAVTVSFGQLVTLMTTSMMAAALGRIGEDLGIDESTTQVTFSIYVLGLAFAPFPIASFSEMYGRRPVWLICNASYVLWNTLCPVGQSPALMVVGRFLAGSSASVGITLTGPIMSDMYRKEDRGKSLAIATFVPYLGPALGPVVGGLMTQKLAWPWLFYLLSIFASVVWAVGFFVIRESYAPVLLAARRRKAEDAAASRTARPFWTAPPDMAASLRRPLELLWRRPVIQVMALVIALNFGVYCLLLSSFATLWIQRYGQSELVSTLHYIAISIGITIATQVGGRFMDWVFARLKARSGDGAGTSPEFRVPCMVPSAVLIPAGLFWYGWAAQREMHWAVVDAGVAVYVCGSFLLSQAMLAYLLDEFSHAASANAASRMLSNVLGFAFPIFAPRLFARLGYGWGNSVLGFVFVGLGCPVPLALWLWGAKLRSLGRRD